jgi:hypothetical protein
MSFASRRRTVNVLTRINQPGLTDFQFMLIATPISVIGALAILFIALFF